MSEHNNDYEENDEEFEDELEQEEDAPAVEDAAELFEEYEITPLTKDEVATAREYNREDARALYGMYLGIQKLRVAASNKKSAHDRRVDNLSDPTLIAHLKKEMHKIEKQCARGLAVFANNQLLGRWCMSNVGISYILTAGLLAQLDVTTCGCQGYRDMDPIPKHKCQGLRNAGSFWRFAGLDPTIEWKEGQRRPYNPVLKTLCYKLSECFKRTRKLPNSFYGKIYYRRKLEEIEKNDSGQLADEAKKRLDKAIKKKWRCSPEQLKVWRSGKLQARGLDLRAMRYTSGIFLSHYHCVARYIEYGDIPKPWIMVHGGHTGWIEPLNFDMVKEAVANGEK